MRNSDFFFFSIKANAFLLETKHNIYIHDWGVLVLVLVLVKRGVSNMLCDFFVWCFLLTIPLSLKFQVCTS